MLNEAEREDLTDILAILYTAVGRYLLSDYEPKSNKYKLRNKTEIIRLRDTQLCAIVLLAQRFADDPEAVPNGLDNIILQVNTGEGKGIICSCTAILFAIYGCKVDVVSSSPVLAMRDCSFEEGCGFIFDLVGVKVGHCCSESEEVRKKVYSEC